MARETKEQRQAREEQARAAHVAEIAEYRKKLPKILNELMELADRLGVDNRVGLDESGPLLQFEFDGNWDSTVLSYESEEWEVEWIREKLIAIKIEKETKEAKKRLAQAVFDRLTAEEKIAIRECIHFCK